MLGEKVNELIRASEEKDGLIARGLDRIDLAVTTLEKTDMEHPDVARGVGASLLAAATIGAGSIVIHFSKKEGSKKNNVAQATAALVTAGAVRATTTYLDEWGSGNLRSRYSLNEEGVILTHHKELKNRIASRKK